MAAYTFSKKVLVLSDDGAPARIVDGFPDLIGPGGIWLAPTGGALVTLDNFGKRLRAATVPDGVELFSLRADAWGDHACNVDPVLREDGMLLAVRTSDHSRPGPIRLLRQPYSQEGPETIGVFREAIGAIDDLGSRLGLLREGQVVLRPLGGPIDTAERPIGSFEAGENILSVTFSPQGDRLAAAFTPGKISIWPTGTRESAPPRELLMEEPDGMFPLAFDPTGRYLTWGSSAKRRAALWDLEGPPHAAPLFLRWGEVGMVKEGLFHPAAPWLAVMHSSLVTFWPLGGPRSYVLGEHGRQIFGLAFDPSASNLVSCGQGEALVWPMTSDGSAARRLLKTKGWCYAIDFTPDGRDFLNCYLGAYMQPIDGGEGRWLFEPVVDSGEPMEALNGCAIDPSGRWAALAPELVRGARPKLLRIVDLKTREMIHAWTLVPPGESEGGPQDWGVDQVAFAGDRVLAAGDGGFRSIGLESGDTRWLWKIGHTLMAASADGRRVLVGGSDTADEMSFGSTPTRLRFFDLDHGEREITSHGSRVRRVAIDEAGEIIVTGDIDGIIRVSRADGSEPHLLTGHKDAIRQIAISPDGRWISSVGGTEVRVWKMPDLSEPPFHSIPYDELMAKLHSFTNLEVVEDEASSTGYRLDIGPFPGWRDVPTW